MGGALGLAPINNTGISAFIVLRSALLGKSISDTSTVSGSPSFILCKFDIIGHVYCNRRCQETSECMWLRGATCAGFPGGMDYYGTSAVNHT